MRQVNRTLLSATALLAVALGAGVTGAALAQGEDAVEVQAGEDAEEVFEDDASGVFDEAEAPTEATDEEAAEETADETVEAQPDAGAAAASGAEVLVVPGSTEESNPGGSTNPGTRPED